MQSRTVFLGWTLSCLVAPLLPAQAAARVPLTAITVAAAISGNGFAVRPAQLEMPAALTSTEANPALYVSGAELLPDNRLRLRVACRQISVCQPFLATIVGASEEEATANLLRLQQSHSEGAGRAVRTEQRVTAGQRTTLLLEDTHMRITLPVLAIDSGAPGTEVRVSSLDRKQVYRAVVTEVGTVRGELQ